MLQVETLPASFAAVLAVFRPCFTAPTFRLFCALVAGVVAQPGRRTVCGMLVGAGLAGVWRHGRAHWFFAGARWRVERVGLVLAQMIVAWLLPADAAVLVAVDDTLFRRSGRRVADAYWQYDGSRPGPRSARVGYGNNWLIAGIVLTLPFTDRPVCLPVAFALVERDGPSRQMLAGQLIEAIAAAVWQAAPGRRIDVVADTAYAGMDGAETRKALHGRGLPAGVSLTSRLRANATLTAIATPVPGKPGRPKRIGARIGSPKDLATLITTDPTSDLTGRARWRPATVHRYGRTDTVELADIGCLWYGVYRSRTVRVILLREPGRAATTGYQLALITTDLDSPAADIVTRYAARWSVEVAIEDGKQTTGAGQARNRTRTAVKRTVPFTLIVQSIVVVWYTRHGHSPDHAAQRRAATPWYRTKTHPSYHDMIIKLRRVLIAAKFRAGTTADPTPAQTLAIHQAWTEAAA